jgi:6-pyruvoyltetrahydropterin/6-carboxytetrahydropterin synthase
MKIAKRFRWEGAHRLPWHDGLCRSLHGHSYTMYVEIEGELDKRGMLMDFKDLKLCLVDLIEAWDHATMVAENDTELRNVVESRDWKHFILPFDTTAENICIYTADYLTRNSSDVLRSHDVTTVRVRVSETETCYAEAERQLG